MTATSTNHLEAWLSETEAAARLGISERSLRRKTQAGEGPEKRERRRPGARPQAVYNPEDVERLAVKPPAVFAPTSRIEPQESAGQLRLPGDTQPNLSVADILSTLIKARVDAMRRPPVRFLTMKQAAEATGLSQTLIRRLIASGRLRAIRDGALKVLESDLATLDVAQVLTARAMTAGAE